MTPAEMVTVQKQFSSEVDALKGNELLDRWNSFENSEESQEPELGLYKSLYLEAALNKEFGIGNWHYEAEKRRKK